MFIPLYLIWCGKQEADDQKIPTLTLVQVFLPGLLRLRDLDQTKLFETFIFLFLSENIKFELGENDRQSKYQVGTICPGASGLG